MRSHRHAPALVGLLAVALVAHGCGGTGGAGVPAPVVPPGHEWGPLPPGPRTPGDAAPPGYQPVIALHNDGPDRTETVCASVPFPWGLVADPAGWSVDGLSNAWQVLQRWPDGSVRVAQAQWTALLGANSDTQWHVVPVPTSTAGTFAPHSALAGALPQFGAEVQDTFGVTYRARWGDPGTEPATTLQETPLVRVRRVHAYHRAPPGQGIRREYLTSTFYLTEFRDQPLVLVDWLFGDDYLGADDPHGSSDPNLHPLGGVDVNRAAFLARGADLMLPYRPAPEGIGPSEASADGFTAFPVMQDSWLGDGQTRR